MKPLVYLDFFINIAAPLLLGCFLYNPKYCLSLPIFIANHIHDGLWAYAFANTMLIIWKREVNVVWLCLAFLTSILFEILQQQHQVEGTGDIYDVITYFIFFLLAIGFNKFFKYSLQPKPQQNAKN